MAWPPAVNDVSLSRFDYTRNADGGKWVTVIATFYSGCTPGRADYPSFTKHVSSLRQKVAAGFLGSGNVAFIASLKNGVNDGVARRGRRSTARTSPRQRPTRTAGSRT